MTQATLFLQMLKVASTLTPVIDRDGTRAIFQFKEPIGGERRVRVIKVGDFRYLD